MRSYWTGKRVVCTGAGGFVGRHLVAALSALGCEPRVIRSRAYDLRREASVSEMYRDAGKIDVLFHLAAHVGGIGANQKHGAEMYSDNVRMDTLLIDYAAHHGVGCFVGMGSVCAYPKHCPLPFKETSLWDGYPEETNAAYGMAKRGMLTALQVYGTQYGLNWRYALSTNLYGPGDNYGEGGHVIAHLVKRFVDAVHNNENTVTLWGTGQATRDFLHVRDIVTGLLVLAERGEREPVNFGEGDEMSIEDTAWIVAHEAGYTGKIQWDASKPDGQPRRCLDITRAIDLGWYSQYYLFDGVADMIRECSGKELQHA